MAAEDVSAIAGTLPGRQYRYVMAGGCMMRAEVVLLRVPTRAGGVYKRRSAARVAGGEYVAASPFVCDRAIV